MNGVGLTTVGRLLRHRNRETTAIYAHLDDAALRDAAAQTEGIIVRAMGYKAEPPPLPGEVEDEDAPKILPEFPKPSVPAARMPHWLGSGDKGSDEAPPKHDPEDRSWNPIMERPRSPVESNPRAAAKGSSPRRPRGRLWY